MQYKKKNDKDAYTGRLTDNFYYFFFFVIKLFWLSIVFN